MADLASSVLGVLTPRRMMKVVFDLMQLSAGTIQRLVPGKENRVVWQEFRNKLEAFDQFENVDHALNLTSKPGVSLTQLVKKTNGLDTHRTIWATEGLGHYHTETHWEQSRVPSSVISANNVQGLPAETMTALHAGMGLSLANRLLKTIEIQSPDTKVYDVLVQFIELCRNNSQPGYVGAAYEALGLVTRNLYPQLIQVVDRQLQKIDQNQVGYLWHGIGRAIYFAPSNFLPFNSAPWRAMAMVQREPPHEIGRLNALAGFAWALAFVNIRHPVILETLLNQHRAELITSDAFANGLTSSILIWRDSTADDSCLDAICQYQPEPSDVSLVELWNERVLKSCRNALDWFYPILKAHDSLGEVFRYQSLPELVMRLQRERTRRVT